MNTNRSHNSKVSYTWDDEVVVLLSSGQSLPVKLASVKNNPVVGYKCTSCGEATSLANGNCGSCGNPFEALDLREAKNLFPEVEVIELKPDRVAYLLLHRAWICLTCNSYNVNYPRNGKGEGTVGCINCGHMIEHGKDILVEDSDIRFDGLSTVANFREKILQIIADRKHPPSGEDAGRRNYESSMRLAGYAGPTVQHEEIANPLARNKWKIISGIFGAGAIAFLIHYGFIEEIDKEIEISGHSWERALSIEEYRRKNGEGWERDINKRNYQHFTLIKRIDKEASWDPYKVKIGTRNVVDYNNCTAKKQDCNTPKVTLSSGVTVDGKPICTTSCTTYGTKPEDIMETRYREHPYLTFSYMDWQTVDILQTSAQDKNPQWHTMNSYAFDNTTKRIGRRSENYSITMTGLDGKKESVNLSFSAWNAIGKGDKCSVKATRWGGVTSKSLTQQAEKCIKQ